VHFPWGLCVVSFVQPRADFQSENPHGQHLAPLAGAERLLPHWEEICSRRVMPSLLSLVIAPCSMIRRVLRGLECPLDFRSLFLLIASCTHVLSRCTSSLFITSLWLDTLFT
jgi:hypothetical protein